MTLTKDEYHTLEEIVGPENISDDPAILDSYAFQWGAELVRGGSKFVSRPEVVILPGSTEEVQAIVKTCNRYRLKYKAYSTGWGWWGGTLTEGVIQLDMRRMDKILEIDEENMFAVIEPYVIGATLQAEAMKVGLNTHMTGAGASCSVLAASTSYMGYGPDGIFMGSSPQNLLSLEWVMPTGDILRTGSLGSGLGWFCGEGPGPSLRAIVRGVQGAAGGMGVFTKCAVKLYPWPGPAVMSVHGTVPAYESLLPDNFRAYTLAFPKWQAYADAYAKLYEAEIGYICHRQFIKMGEDLQAAMIKIISDSNKTLSDLEGLLKTPEIQKLTEELRRSFQIVLAGMTSRDIEYQEKVLDEILAQTGGWKVASLAEPEMQRYMLLYLIKLCFKNLNFVYAGGYQGTFSQKGPPDFAVSYIEPATEMKRQHIAKGGIVDDGGDTGMGTLSTEGGGTECGFEFFVLYDPHDTDSVNATREVMKESAQIAKELRLGPGMLAAKAAPLYGKQRKALLLSVAQPSVYHWQKKIKEALDPNDTSDGSYVYLE